MTSKADVCKVIVTAPDADWLVEFTRQLVSDRLAACGHITSAIRSIYRWDGSIHDHTEARVALHTRTSLFDDIARVTIAAHPYDVPCVIAIPIRNAAPTYHQWILDSTTDLADLEDTTPGGSVEG